MPKMFVSLLIRFHWKVTISKNMVLNITSTRIKIRLSSKSQETSLRCRVAILISLATPSWFTEKRCSTSKSSERVHKDPWMSSSMWNLSDFQLSRTFRMKSMRKKREMKLDSFLRDTSLWSLAQNLSWASMKITSKPKNLLSHMTLRELLIDTSRPTSDSSMKILTSKRLSSSTSSNSAENRPRNHTSSDFGDLPSSLRWFRKRTPLSRQAMSCS